MNNEWSLINRTTGEIKELTDYANRNNGYKRKMAIENREGRATDFTVSVMKNINEVSALLTTAQCGYLMLLQCYVGYDDGVLVDGKSPMTTTDMMTVLQLTRKTSTFYDFLSACIDNGIVTESNGVYAVNQRYHFRGAFGNQYVVKSYTAKIKRVYREVKATDIGLIYRMLPFVHYETNALCDNPFENDPRKIRWFNQRELADNIGVDPVTLRRCLPKMTFDGEYVIARIRVGSEPERYTFNPRVFYRLDAEPDNTLQALFNVNSQLERAK